MRGKRRESIDESMVERRIVDTKQHVGISKK